MTEQTTPSDPGKPYRTTGLGCIGCALVLALMGVVAFVAIMAEVFNYSVEGQVAGAGGTLCCFGFGLALVGVAFFLIGRSKSAKAADSA